MFAPKVVLDDETLVKGTDYNVAYRSNKNVGTATVTITGKGDYTGTIAKTSKKVTKLKKKTRYYVHVRTYMKVGGKTYYSAWSKAKVKKTK